MAAIEPLAKEHRAGPPALSSRKACWFLFFPHDQDRAVGVPDDRVGDAAQEGSPYSPKAPASHHYHSGVEPLGEVNDLLPRWSFHRKVRLRHDPPGLLYLLYLLVQCLLAVPFEPPIRFFE